MGQGISRGDQLILRTKHFLSQFVSLHSFFLSYFLHMSFFVRIFFLLSLVGWTSNRLKLEPGS